MTVDVREPTYPRREVVTLIALTPPFGDPLRFVVLACGHERRLGPNDYPSNGDRRECRACPPVRPARRALADQAWHGHYRVDGRGRVEHSHEIVESLHAHAGEPDQPDLRPTFLPITAYDARLKDAEGRTTMSETEKTTETEKTSETVREPNDDTGADASDAEKTGDANEPDR